MSKQNFMIIDGNSILNRAFYGMRLLSTSDGVYTNAVLGFLNIMQKYQKEVEPKYMCVAFDLKAKTFRHKAYEGYKAQRKGMPEELLMQVPLIKEVLDAMNIKRLEVEGFEADDIIGSLANGAKTSGIDVVIVTGDRDSLQLVDNKVCVKIPKTKMGKTQTEDYDVSKIKEVYGLLPKQLIEVKGLMGDTSDNIPGVRGVGEKTALSLIAEFGSIENLYQNIDNVSKKGVREKLINDKEMAFLSKRLGTICDTMDVFHDISDFAIGDYDKERLYQIFKRLEFKSFIDRFGLGDRQDIKETTPKLKRDVHKIQDVFSLSELASKIEKQGQLYFCYKLDNNSKMKRNVDGFVIDLDDKLYSVDFSLVDGKNFLDIMKPVFESEKVEKYTHNVKDLYTVLFVNDIKLNNLKFDTMIGAYLLNPTKTKLDMPDVALDFLNVTLCNMPNKPTKDDNIDDILVEYTNVIKELVGTIKKEIENKEQIKLYYDIELPLIEVLASLEYWGFKVDKSTLEELSTQLDEKISKLTTKIYDIVGEEFNINSPKQLGIILAEKLNLPLKKTKTGYSTDAQTLEALKNKSEVVELILEYRQLSKLKSTYTESLVEKADKNDGKIHSTFNQTVTATGRISSTDPNLQNIPIKTELGRLIRKAFVPESEEFVLLDADYSQIELRVLAHVTGDSNMIEAFRNNEDIHTATASKVFGVDAKDVTDMLRRRAKAINFGIIYGMGDFSLAKDLGISRDEAKKYIDSYFKQHPKVSEYLENVVEKGEQDGYVSTIFNRVRYLPELLSTNFNIKAFGKRVAMNMPIQGSAADIIKIAMILVYKKLKERNLKSRLILQIHDELLIETHVSEVEEVSKILKDCMENAVTLDVPLTVEVKRGLNWYEAK